jgi:hypothetical protein
VTSTSAEVRLKPDTTTETTSVRLQADQTRDATFRASHFFVLASLLAATGAVVMSRQSTPEHLVLISLTIASAGLAAAGFYRMLSPLVSHPTDVSQEPLSDRARAMLDREKALALRALKELEFDRSMGKVSQADFEEMAGRLRSRALSFMKQLDEDASGYRSVIERELQSRLASSATKPETSALLPAHIEQRTAAHSEQRTAAHSAQRTAHSDLCTCGTANDPDAVFCKRCGTKLA